MTNLPTITYLPTKNVNKQLNAFIRSSKETFPLQQASNVDILSTIGVLHQIARLVAKVNK